MVWTHFWDMHSGGGTKEPPYEHILIEAPEDEARVIFYNRFGHSPDRVSCTCCGSDYSVSEDGDLAQITAYQRNCAYGYVYVDTGERVVEDVTIAHLDYVDGKRMFKGREVTWSYFEEPDYSTMKYGATRVECQERYQTLEQYLEDPEVKVIRAEEIQSHERIGSVPEQGYVGRG